MSFPGQDTSAGSVGPASDWDTEVGGHGAKENQCLGQPHYVYFTHPKSIHRRILSEPILRSLAVSTSRC